MRRLTNSFLVFVILFIGLSIDVSSQGLTNMQNDKITSEINAIFEKSIKEGEKLAVSEMFENVNDTLKTGFIDNGYYFSSFADVMKGFEVGIKGIESQKMSISEKRVTVLSDKVVLLTASGNYFTALKDGRNLNGKFAWTFVYSKFNDNWKIIHSHMSNPCRK